MILKRDKAFQNKPVPGELDVPGVTHFFNMPE